MLRCDGLYRSAVREPGEEHPYRLYLRFYPDGCVIDQSIIESANVAEILRWFHRDKPLTAKGEYSVEGDAIRFRTTLEYGMDRDGTCYPPVRVDYAGKVLPDRLVLQTWTENRAVSPEEEFVFEAAE